MSFIPLDFRNSSSRALYDSHLKRSWSYSELHGQTQEIARRLSRPRKSLVFLFCRNDAACVLGYLGALGADHAVALLDHSLLPEFKLKLIDLYRPEFVLSPDSSLALGKGDAGRSYCLDQVGDPPLSCWLRNTGEEGGIHRDLALLLSTSGSTGTPKFVRLTRKNAESNARSIQLALRITGEERAITSLPMHYSYGLSVLNSHLRAGASVVMTAEGLMSPDFWDAFRREQCTSWAGVPYSYQILRRLNLDTLDVPTLRTLTQAGGKLSTDLIAHFHRCIANRGGSMYVMYGQTEATARISVLDARLLPEKLGSAGTAIPDGLLAIDTGEELTTEENVSGEVVYRGPNVMMGYADAREDLSHGDELGGCLRTGDSGYLDGGGCLFLTGRRKRDAKVFGLRLNMDEVEGMLRFRGPTAVVSHQEKLVIYCEYGDPESFTQYARELASRLKLHLGAFEFRRVTQLPLNANGKIDYQALGQQP